MPGSGRISGNPVFYGLFRIQKSYTSLYLRVGD